MSADLSPIVIDLAREAPFRLAGAEVRPATREVVQGDRREVLQPRVMQVLVALARNAGEVVSRHDLIQACWAGRVVGEDAIDRCIAAVRRLAEALGAFDVETIPRVGYRLNVLAAAADAAAAARRTRGRWIVAGLAVAVLAVAAGVILTLSPWRAAPTAPRVAVRPFLVLGGTPQLKVIADGLSDDIAGAVEQTHLGATSPGQAAGDDVVVGATLTQEGPDLRVRAYLLDATGANTLWTQSFRGSASNLPALREQMSGAVAEAAQIAAEPFRQKGLQLDPVTRALYIEGGLAMAHPDALKGGEAAAAFAAAAAKSPHFVAARAMLALEHVATAAREVDPTVRTRKLEAGRAEALTAIRDDSHAAEGAYLALYRYERARDPTDLARMEDALTDGLARATQPSLLQAQECRLLAEVGRALAAADHCQRASALRPMGTASGADYGHALYIAGGLDLAMAQLDTTLRLHPDSLNARTRRMEIALFSEPPHAALQRLHDDGLRPQDWQTPHVRVAELFLKARESRSEADIQRFMETIEPLVAAGFVPPRYFVLCATSLGRTDIAFQTLASTPVTTFERDGFLFEPATEPLRRDPRFLDIVRRFGLADYWRKRNAWPDFCGEPNLPYACRAAAPSISANVSPFVSFANSTPARLTAHANAR